MKNKWEKETNMTKKRGKFKRYEIEEIERKTVEKENRRKCSQCKKK
jgi:hypothetical protein